MTYSQTQLAIIKETYKAVEKLGGGSDLLSPIGSWGNDLEDSAVLESIKSWNETFNTNPGYGVQEDQ